MAALLLRMLLVVGVAPLASSASTDLTALLALKDAVSHDPDSVLAAWSSASTNYCFWRGVSCHPNSSAVAAIDLPDASLSGALPASLPPRLHRLDLHGNNFSGPVPAAFLASPTLRSLDLSYNRLSGPLPPSCRTHSLTHLRLAANVITAQIPADLAQCRSLRLLDLSSNLLEGSIPSSFAGLAALRALDLSRNSLTDRIPPQLSACRDLAVLVLTNITTSPGEQPEFNAFVGGLPPQLLDIPALQILWAPKANLNGRLPSYRNGSCSLRALNLAQNYIACSLPPWLRDCPNLAYLDLSSNKFEGPMPVGFRMGCMKYLNVAQNSLSGHLLPAVETDSKCSSRLIIDDTVMHYYERLVSGAMVLSPSAALSRDAINVVIHDFSNNSFSGPLPSIALHLGGNFSYGLLLNSNMFNSTLSSGFFGFCKGASGVTVNLSDNQLTGGLDTLSSCPVLWTFDAGYNKINGLISLGVANLHFLRSLILRGNNLTGEIPGVFGDLSALEVLDLSRNYLTGRIPSSLAHASQLQALMLDHNMLSGGIPPSFSELAQLAVLDISFNNLSGDIPRLRHSTDCGSFVGNPLLHPCLGPNGSLSTPDSTNGAQQDGEMSRSRSVMVIIVAAATAMVSFLLVVLIFVVCERRKSAKIANLRAKMLVTFGDAPPELTYDNLVQATSNFSIQNLIGSGGFGSTYKAELAPGFLVAVKRLAMGRFQGLQQFDAEIRTLGRIRHRNLVTLMGYHIGESDTFLIYNYLSGGNLETFINGMGSRKVSWTEVQNIAEDVAEALAFLHCSCTPRIIHRDIKPSNILLDEELNAYLSDFGLARLMEVTQTHATTDVAGTFGYVAPEYATTRRVSDKADVYSFGVVLLELMSGKRSLDPSFSQFTDGFTIVGWGRMLAQEGNTIEFFSPGLWDVAPMDKLTEMLRVALSCTSESLADRPSMRQVAEKLKQLRNEQ
ncbi:LRR receptor-like serine/threonine-protein kinase RPK2 [Oryza brachyantha]|uniref:LRR receptor-like serine/threonine-protein kinase RPK2 n=1 Tax=Oryza brachyantha TaxID=4533 RepID=UPI001ADA3E10|nr:LRR receptor-like serine/threonine-protein kinase RPK2 [Oryza brachyantha]